MTAKPWGKAGRVLDMGNATDDELEAVLGFVRCIARMTMHADKVYDDVEAELTAFDALIRKARELTGADDDGRTRPAVTRYGTVRS